MNLLETQTPYLKKKTFFARKKESKKQKQKKKTNTQEQFFSFFEQALEEALPALAMAAEALKSLRKDDIAEVKALQNPPEAVKRVCQCVLELKPSGNEDPSQGWIGCKIMMGDANFLAKLQKFKKNHLLFFITFLDLFLLFLFLFDFLLFLFFAIFISLV